MVFCLAGKHHENNDGRAEDCGNGADAQLRGGKKRSGQQIAEQTEYGPAQKTGGQHDQRFCRTKKALDQMRHRNAHEGDGTCKRGDAGGQNAGKQDQRHTEGLDVDTHVLGVNLTHLVCADRLGKKEAQQHGSADHHGHNRHLIPRHTGKAAHRPVVEVDNVGVLGKGHHKIRNRRADIADHHAADHQQGHFFDPLRDQQDKAHGQHGTGKSRSNERQGV